MGIRRFVRVFQSPRPEWCDQWKEWSWSWRSRGRRFGWLLLYGLWRWSCNRLWPSPKYWVCRWKYHRPLWRRLSLKRCWWRRRHLLLPECIPRNSWARFLTVDPRLQWHRIQRWRQYWWLQRYHGACTLLPINAFGNWFGREGHSDCRRRLVWFRWFVWWDLGRQNDTKSQKLWK